MEHLKLLNVILNDDEYWLDSIKDYGMVRCLEARGDLRRCVSKLTNMLVKEVEECAKEA